MSDAIYKLKMGQDNYNDIKFNQYDKGGYITFKLLDAEGQAFNVQEGDLVTAEWNMTNNKAIIQTKEEQIIEIKTQKLEWPVAPEVASEEFLFVWGWPGPDYSTYLRKDYGQTWAYTKEELLK